MSDPRLYYLLILTVAIVIHEAGHYVFARLFGVRVRRASLFFNPFFTLVKYDPLTGRIDLLSNKKPLLRRGGAVTVEASDCKLSVRVATPAVDTGVWDRETGTVRAARRMEWNAVIVPSPYLPRHVSAWKQTQYCIGWLPCGGYVTLNPDASPTGILSKKNHQQFLIHAAGILFNIAAMLIALGAAKGCLIAAGTLPALHSMGDIYTLFGVLLHFAWVSFFLIILNALPLPGLDGAGMLLALLDYILPASAQRIVKTINNILSIVVFLFIISSWFREALPFERYFISFVYGCYDAIENLVLAL